MLTAGFRCAEQIPIQKLKPQRPAPAVQPQRMAGAKGSLPVSAPPAAPQPARKKLKSAAGDWPCPSGDSKSNSWT